MGILRCRNAVLRRSFLHVIEHIPGVGRGFQDHPGVCCLWECSDSLPSRPAPEAVIFWKSEAGLGSPDFQILQTVLSGGDAAKLGLPAGGWALIGNVDETPRKVELRGSDNLVDARLGALAAAINAERSADFPSGRLFLDSIEKAVAVALVNSYAVYDRALGCIEAGSVPHA